MDMDKVKEFGCTIRTLYFLVLFFLLLYGLVNLCLLKASWNKSVSVSRDAE